MLFRDDVLFVQQIKFSCNRCINGVHTQDYSKTFLLHEIGNSNNIFSWDKQLDISFFDNTFKRYLYILFLLKVLV